MKYFILKDPWVTPMEISLEELQKIHNDNDDCQLVLVSIKENEICFSVEERVE